MICDGSGKGYGFVLALLLQFPPLLLLLLSLSSMDSPGTFPCIPSHIVASFPAFVLAGGNVADTPGIASGIVVVLARIVSSTFVGIVVVAFLLVVGILADTPRISSGDLQGGGAAVDLSPHTDFYNFLHTAVAPFVHVYPIRIASGSPRTSSKDHRRLFCRESLWQNKASQRKGKEKRAKLRKLTYSSP